MTIKKDETLLRATEVFGSEAKAKGWLKMPCSALGGLIPEQIMKTPEGAESVLAVLTRIEHGIFS